MKRFVLVGRTALATGEFSLDDLASSSGRLDVLLRSVRAALLISNGLRRDVIVDLVLGGGASPRVLRFDGQSAKFIRPDERSLAILVQKTLRESKELPAGAGFHTVRPGVLVGAGGLELSLADAASAKGYWLDEGAPDIRGCALPSDDALFVIGDQLGFDDATTERLRASNAERISVGPLSLHSEDVVTLLHSELDRRFVAPGS